MPLFLVILLTPFKYLDLNLEDEDDFESAMLGEVSLKLSFFPLCLKAHADLFSLILLRS